MFSSVIKISNTLFSSELKINYSKKLIAAIVLHILPAFAVANVSKMSLSDILSLNDIVKQRWKRLEEDGSKHCGFQMTGNDGKKPGRSAGKYE